MGGYVRIGKTREMGRYYILVEEASETMRVAFYLTQLNLFFFLNFLPSFFFFFLFLGYLRSTL